MLKLKISPSSTAASKIVDNLSFTVRPGNG